MVWWLYAPQWNPFLAGLENDGAAQNGIDSAFTELAKHNPQASCLWSPADGFHQFSPNWSQITGQLPRDCMGESWLDYWDDEARIHFDEALASLFSADKSSRPESCVVEGSVMHGEGQWVSLQFSLLPSGMGSQQKLTLLVADVTEQKQLREQAAAAQRQSEAALHCRSSFLSNMSHELRTPLNAILGFAQMLEKGSLNDQDTAKEYLQHIRISGQDLLTKISDLIELANIDAGQARLDDDAINLKELIATAVEMQSHRAFEKSITLHQERGKPHLIVRADRPKLLHCISHLLAEAISHSPENSIIAINYHADEQQGVQISVHDRGAGYTPKRLENVRKTLNNGHSYFQTDIHDVSIGLAICKEMMELHEGTLNIDSIAGRGTITTLSLPSERIISMSAQIKRKDTQFS